MIRSSAALALLLVVGVTAQSAPPVGYSPNIPVSAPTRIDWTFTVSNRSQTDPPESLIAKDYDSTKQSYEFFLPTRKDAKQPIGAIVFISTSDEPSGWKSYQSVCKQLGLAFIGPRGAGNNVPSPKRARIVLDCFDDVRRQVPLDHDRTYISGVSGGGRMACGIGFAHPEYFGGILSVVAGGDIRPEPWLRHRAIDRLSIALITGTTDFNRGEVERWLGPYWKGIGIRSKVWVANMGHTMPPAATLLEAVKFLDEGRTKRADTAKKFPTTRALPDKVPTRDQAATAMFEEGQDMLKEKATVHRGLMLVKGVSERWPDTEAGKAARQLLIEFQAKSDKSWQMEDIAEQRTQLIAEARALADYSINGVPAGSPYEKSRPMMATAAIQRWSVLIADAPDSDLAKEGNKLVEQLRPLAAKGK